MELQKYQEIIKMTAVYPKEFGYGYCMLGLIGEVTEYFKATKTEDEAAIEKEAGDCWWYLTALTNEFNAEATQVFVNLKSNTKQDLAYYSETFFEAYGELAEIVKKYYRDNKWVADQSHIETLLFDLSEGLHGMQHVRGGLDIGKVLEINYNKLIKRRETNTLHGSGDNREETN